MEFETLYQQFVMPTIRGTEKGSKKRYAGWVQQGDGMEVVFKGMEAVRSDWTPLAKAFQQGLYRRFFEGKETRTFIVETIQALHRGELDHDLVYQRRLRRRLDQYEKQKPPHIQAALFKKAHNPRWSGRTIRYVKTVAGWQPEGHVQASIDYAHYMDKQLAPIADALLHFQGERFQTIADAQLLLF